MKEVGVVAAMKADSEVDLETDKAEEKEVDLEED